MWAEEHDGRYPERLALLVPDYLRRLPHCPTAGYDTYSSTYQTSLAGHFYGVCCGGEHHRNVKLKANHPAYNSVSEGSWHPGFTVGLESCQHKITELVSLIEEKGIDNNKGWEQALAQDKSLSLGCPTGQRGDTSRPRQSQYQVDFYEGGYEVLCTSHSHLALGVPPLFPRYDSQAGFVPFEFLPSRDIDRSGLIRRIIPVIMLIFVLSRLQQRRKSAKVTTTTGSS